MGVVKAKTYKKKDHGISLDQIDPDALYIIQTLQDAGYTAYLVGGAIRDLLLGAKPKDYDISTSAKPEEIKKVFRSRCLLIGRRFRLAHIRFHKKVIEVATFRSGDSEDEDLITQDNEWGTAEEDVLRRDFKINGLFYDPANETVIDYVGGVKDAKARKLCVIGEPYVRFKQDPVRMIRLLKFLARFDLKIDKKTKLDFTECRQEILKSSQARILEEVMRMLHSGAAGKFFKLMSEYGLLEPLFPELSDYIEKDTKSRVFKKLDEVDQMIEKYPDIRINRSILASCLVFPLIDDQIRLLCDEREKPPHLALIQTITKTHIDTTFNTFFQLSRKIKSEMVYLISWQYRLVPPKDDIKIQYRVPPSIHFVHALKFLNLRARLYPEWQTVYNAWRTLYDEAKKTPNYFKAPKKRYRPRRRR